MRQISLAAAFRRISGLTGISRLLGFGRDITFAAFLGAGPAADAFLVALKLPNMFRRLTAEGALANAFVPSFAEMRSADGNGAAMRLAGEVQTTLMIALLALVVAAEIFMPSIISFLAPGFADTSTGDDMPGRFDVAVDLARITFPYLPMISLVAFWAAIANAHDRFSVAALLPVIFNICLIVGALALPFWDMALADMALADMALADMAMGDIVKARPVPLALALLVAGILQLAIMGMVLHRAGIMPGWHWPRLLSPARRMWRRFVTASAGAVAIQINLVVDLVLASLLGVGAISWLYYADRIVQLPLGVIGIALGTALLPRLSAQFREQDRQPARQTLADAILFAAFLVLPASVALAMIGPQIITGLFRYGAFSMSDALASGMALAIYAVGLPGHLLLKILQPAFYAAFRPGLVLAVSVAMVAMNIGLSITLMQIYGHLGLAMATSASGIFAAATLMIISVRSGYVGTLPISGLLRISAACAVMALALVVIDRLLPPVAGWLVMAALVGGGGGAFLLAAWGLRAIPRQLLRG